MDIEVSSQLLKNVLSSLWLIQPEVNLIFTSNPAKIQFVISKIEGFMFWSIDVVIINAKSEFESVTIMIDKICKTITTETDYTCRLSKQEKSLILTQFTTIKNCLSNGNRINDVKINMELNIPYVINHPSITENIFEFNRYKEGLDKNFPKLCAIFKHKLFEHMINSCLDISCEVEVGISNNTMFFKSESIDDKLVISSPILENNDIAINKRLELKSLSYIKTYRKICHLIAVEIVKSKKTYYLSIKPITPKLINTELVLSFV